MSADLVCVQPIRFGNFELDLRRRELRKCKLHPKLEEKPFQVLELLVERADTLVTQKELRVSRSTALQIKEAIEHYQRGGKVLLDFTRAN
jgi:hypothetical protein